MDGEKKIVIQASNTTQELVIREGEALHLDPPKKVSIIGLLSAPAKFYEARQTEIVKLQAHLLVNRLGRTLTLRASEREEKGTEVQGALTFNPELTEFGINADRMYNKKQFTDLLRKRRMFFANRDEYDIVMEQLAKFEYSRTVNGEHKDDLKGNKRDLTDKTLKQNLKETFKLVIPIFKGEQPSTFFVEIRVDVSDSETKFWLESIELKELEKRLTDELINAQLECFLENRNGEDSKYQIAVIEV